MKQPPFEVVQHLHTPVPGGTDLRFAGPTHACLCGSELFQVVAAFEKGVVALYFLDALCVECGSVVTLPTEDEATTFDVGGPEDLRRQ